MATKRFGYLDDLSLKGQKVGIGTSTANEKLEVLGGTRGGDVVVTGIATLTSYSGFQNNKTSYVDNVNITGGESGTLSGEVVIGAGLTMSVGTGATTGQGSIDSLKVSNTFTPPIGLTADRPTAPKPGALFYNKEFRTIEYWDGNFWRQVDNATRRGRGLFTAGYRGDTEAETDIITYVEVSTLGNAQEFGNLSANGTGSRRGGCSNGTRGLAGGAAPGNDYIDYLTIASTGNSQDFGNLTVGRYNVSSCSSSTRGVWMGGLTYPSPGDRDTIDYVEIATTGNALDFGNLTASENNVTAAASPTRGFCFGLAPTGALGNVGINMITIASTGNAIDFGDGSYGFVRCAAGSNNVSSLIAGRQGPADDYRGDMIQKFNMASGGNTINFGDLTVSKAVGISAVTNGTRAVWGGGFTDPTAANMSTVIDYIEFATSGNAENFGDMGTKRDFYTAINDTHGGLGGF